MFSIQCAEGMDSVKKSVFALLFIIIIGGCAQGNEDKLGNDSNSSERPPELRLEIDGEEFEAKMGSYCWEHQESDGERLVDCDDNDDSVKATKNIKPIQTKADQKVLLKMDGASASNTKTHLTQVKKGDKEEISVKEGQFSTPNEKGTYNYKYEVEWLEGNENEGSHSVYAFNLKVD